MYSEATSDAKIWSYTTDYGIMSSLAVVNGVVYVDSHDSHIYALGGSSTLDHFVFSSVSTQAAGTSFIVTITALDAIGNKVTGYIGTARAKLNKKNGK